MAAEINSLGRVGEAHPEARRGLAEVGRFFYDRGWSLGTSSNYSVVVGAEPVRLLITASGRDKGRLGTDDFVVVDGDGRAVDPPDERPSAETLLHTMLVGAVGARAVLHTHSVWGTLLSERHFERRWLEISGYEMIKGIAGHTSHEQRLRVPIFDNSQDIRQLARVVEDCILPAGPESPRGFLLRNHGLYTWGRDLNEARRHIEIFEFLFEVVGRAAQMTPA